MSWVFLCDLKIGYLEKVGLGADIMVYLIKILLRRKPKTWKQ